jgi:hypothetical protein
MEDNNQGNVPPIIVNNPPPAPAPAPAPAVPPVIVTPGNQQGAGSQNTIPWWGFMGGYGGYGNYGGWGGYSGGRGYGGWGGHGGAPYYVDQARREADHVRDLVNQRESIENNFSEQNLQKLISDSALAATIGHKDLSKDISDASLNNTLGQSRIENSIADSFARLSLSACQSNADMRQQFADCCCDIRKEISDCCCDTQKEIMRQGFMTQQGFATLDRTACDQGSATRAAMSENTQKILDKISNSELTETRDKLHNAQRELSEARLPTEILNTFKNCGCCNDNGHHGRGGGGGENTNEIMIMINNMARSMANLEGRLSAMSSGRNGPPGPP